MAVKRLSNGAYVEHCWKEVLNQFDRGLVRSGKTLAKQSQISIISIDNGKIHAQMNSKGYDGGIYSIVLPCVDNWVEFIDELAFWFVHHLNCLSLCLSGEWNNDFFSFIEQSGLYLFPKQTFAKQLQWESTCTCRNLEPVCKHVVGVIYKLIWDMEDDPFHAVELVCIKPDILMSRIHVLSNEWILKSDKLQEVETSKNQIEDFCPLIWDCENTVYNQYEHNSIHSNVRQIKPEINNDEVTTMSKYLYGV